jgi:lipid A oxidase
MRIAILLAATLLTPVLSASAGELEVGVYGGMNESHGSRGELSDGTTTQEGDFDWQGRSFDAPIYYGAKVTYWPDSLQNWGFGIDFTHAKVYADLDAGDAPGNYTTLEFTDGLNLLTANAYYKHDWGNGFRAYGGAGLGINIPHVEITTTAATVVGPSETFEYQVAGPALQAVAGASYEVFDNWRVFGEYKLSYASVDAELAGGAGSFNTDIVSHHLLAGISFAFDAGDF